MIPYLSFIKEEQQKCRQCTHTYEIGEMEEQKKFTMEIALSFPLPLQRCSWGSWGKKLKLNGDEMKKKEEEKRVKRWEGIFMAGGLNFGGTFLSNIYCQVHAVMFSKKKVKK